MSQRAVLLGMVLIVALALTACASRVIRLPGSTMCKVSQGIYARDTESCVYDTGQRFALNDQCADQGGTYNSRSHYCRIELPDYPLPYGPPSQ
jgi:hypothetical protein